MDAGTVSIKLMADAEALIAQLKRAESAVSSSVGKMSDMADMAKGAFAGMMATLGVAALAGFIKSAADAAGSLHDLSIQTGASEASLHAFRKVGAFTDTTVQDITGAMGKLAKNMATASEEGKGTSAALRAMGINVADFQRLKPEEQMLQVAQAMNKYADGSGKSAAAQQLFGREGAKLLPYLKDLANSADEVTRSLTDQEIAYRANIAAAGDDFGDNLTKLTKGMGGLKNVIVEGMLPALALTSQAFVEVMFGVNGVKDEAGKLAKDGSIANWTEGVIRGLSYVIDIAQGASRYVVGLGKSFAGLAAGIRAFMSQDTVYAGIQEFNAAYDAAEQDLQRLYSTDTMGKQFRDRMDAIRAATGATEDSIKPTLDFAEALKKAEKAHRDKTVAMTEEEKEAKKQADLYAKLKSAIDEKTGALDTSLVTGHALRESEKILNQLQADLTNGVLKLTDAQYDELMVKVMLLQRSEELADARKRETAEADYATKEYAQLVDKMQQSTASTQDQIKATREANDTYGMTTAQLDALAIAKMIDTAKTYEQRAAYLEQEQIGSQLAAAYRDQADKLRQLAALKEQGIHVKAARDAKAAWEQTTKAIGDGLVSALTRAVMEGQDIWLTFRNYLVQTILDGVIRNALASAISGGMRAMGFSAAGSAAPGLFGAMGAGAGAAGGAAASAAGATGAGMASGSAAFDAALASSGAGSAGSASALGSATLQSAGVVAAGVLAYNYLKGPASPWETVGSGVNAASFGDIPWLQSRNRDTGATMFVARENPAFQGSSITDLLAAIDAAGRQSYFAYMAYGDSPGLATGTNYVPHDMVATIHQGEAVVPRKYNPAAGGAYDGGTGATAVADELRSLRTEVQLMARSAKQTADILNAVSRGGSSLKTVAA